MRNLFAVDLRDLRAAGRPMLAAFALAAAGTCAGAFLAGVAFTPLLGDDAWRLAGPLTGTYIGGSVNFVGLGRALDVPDAVFTAATASDNLLTGLWLGVTLALRPLKRWPARRPDPFASWMATSARRRSTSCSKSPTHQDCRICFFKPRTAGDVSPDCDGICGCCQRVRARPRRCRCWPQTDSVRCCRTCSRRSITWSSTHPRRELIATPPCSAR